MGHHWEENIFLACAHTRTDEWATGVLWGCMSLPLHFWWLVYSWWANQLDPPPQGTNKLITFTQLTPAAAMSSFERVRSKSTYSANTSVRMLGWLFHLLQLHSHNCCLRQSCALKTRCLNKLLKKHCIYARCAFMFHATLNTANKVLRLPEKIIFNFYTDTF